MKLNSTVRKSVICKMLDKEPKTFEQIINKPLTSNNARVTFFTGVRLFSVSYFHFAETNFRKLKFSNVYCAHYNANDRHLTPFTFVDLFKYYQAIYFSSSLIEFFVHFDFLPFYIYRFLIQFATVT